MFENIKNEKTRDLVEKVYESSLFAVTYVPDKLIERPILTNTLFIAGSVGAGFARGYSAAHGNHIPSETLDAILKYGPAAATGATYGSTAFFFTLAYGHAVPVQEATKNGLLGGLVGAAIGGLGTMLGYAAGSMIK